MSVGDVAKVFLLMLSHTKSCIGIFYRFVWKRANVSFMKMTFLFSYIVECVLVVDVSAEWQHAVNVLTL